MLIEGADEASGPKTAAGYGVLPRLTGDGAALYDRRLSLTEARARIAHFKVPRYWRFVDAFPMTVTGKVQKFRMREISIAALAGSPMDS